MKLKRQKKTRRVLQYYKVHYNIVPPYKVVCDSEFLQAALLGRVQLRHQLPKTLQVDNTLVSHIRSTIHYQRNPSSNAPQSATPNTVQSINLTRCILRAIEQKGNLYGGALHIAKTLTFLSCRHKAKHVSESECIHALVSNDNNDRLVCALNDRTIRRDIRALGHTPVLFIRDNVLLMEQPTERVKSELQHNALQQINSLEPTESTVVHKLHSEETPPTHRPKPVKKPAKGPNPLSMKKKKVHLTAEQRLALKAAKQAAVPSNAEPSAQQHGDHTETNADSADTSNIVQGTRKRKRSRHGKQQANAATTEPNVEHTLSTIADTNCTTS